jgi:hypothetical protein
MQQLTVPGMYDLAIPFRLLLTASGVKGMFFGCLVMSP